MHATPAPGPSRPRRAGRPPLATILLAFALPLLMVAPPATLGAATSSTAPAGIPAPPGAARVLLPATTATAQRAAARPATAQWLVGVDGARAQLARVAARHGGRLMEQLDVIVLPARHAGALAAELGDAVRWAGPNHAAARSSTIDTPDGERSGWSRGALAPPAAGPLARIGIVDDLVNRQVPDLAGVRQINRVPIEDSHGTMVASVAAAPRNGKGVIGVAPGAPVSSFGTASLFCNDVASGIVELARRGVRVINVSLVFDYECAVIEEAVAFAYAKGATVVAASGNDGELNDPLMYPASYPHVVTVGAVDASLTVPAFSDTSPQLDLVAPGVGIPALLPRAADRSDGVVDGIEWVDGTSFASPAVAGAVSWLLGARPQLRPGQVHAILRASARDVGPVGWDPASGFGLAQISAALAIPTPAIDALEPNDAPWAVRVAGAPGAGVFGKRAVWTGAGPTSVTATGDSADDAVDGYRIRIPARRAVSVELVAGAADVNLYAFGSSVRSFYAPSRPLAASTRPAGQPDVITLRNTSAKPRELFVVVNTPEMHAARTLSNYRLSFRRR